MAKIMSDNDNILPEQIQIPVSVNFAFSQFKQKFTFYFKSQDYKILLYWIFGFHAKFLALSFLEVLHFGR